MAKKQDEVRELIDQLLGQMDLIRKQQRKHIKAIREQNRLLRRAIQQERRDADDWWKDGGRPPWDCGE